MTPSVLAGVACDRMEGNMAEDMGLGTSVLLDAAASGSQAYAGAVFEVVMSAFVLTVEMGSVCSTGGGGGGYGEHVKRYV